MEVIARKETEQPWHTGSELRWVYKKRNNQVVQARVIYYVDGKRVDAPWTHFATSWANYGETRMEKIPEAFQK